MAALSPPANEQQRSCISSSVSQRRSQPPVHSPYRAVPLAEPQVSSGRKMAARWIYVALAALLAAITLHEVDASPNATIANGSVNGPISVLPNYNVSSDDLITPDEINAGLLEYVAGPLPLAAVDAAKPRRENARPAAIYMNEFAVYIPRGGDVADSIAHKYGFSNMGQVGAGGAFNALAYSGVFRMVKVKRKCQTVTAGPENNHATMMRM
uniref:Peptidase S8 pro-domain domain-containing protein n=1 Tax=Anopheles stephensi TaxID=30069 RepID=A0A182XV28_ANOST